MVFIWLIIRYVNRGMITKAKREISQIIATATSEAYKNRYIQRILPITGLLVTAIIVHQLFKDVEGIAAQSRGAVQFIFFFANGIMLRGAIQLYRCRDTDQYLIMARQLNWLGASVVGGSLFLSRLLGAIIGVNSVNMAIWSLALLLLWILMLVLMHRVSRLLWVVLFSSFAIVALINIISIFLPFKYF